MLKPRPLLAAWLALSVGPLRTFAQAQELEECAAVPVETYNMSLRVGSLFIILATSALGVFAPMVLYRIRPHSPGSVRDWLLMMGKFFGTGVILATAFVHMLPEALHNFASPCLSPGWRSYHAFAGIFCMLASFALQLLELAAVANLDRLRQERKDTQADLEKRATADCSSASTSDDNVTLSQRDTPGHVHSAGLLEAPDASFRNVGTLILELGIVMHSIIIGISLANTSNDGFTTLLIALVFHQFFEGVALGTRVNEIECKNWIKPALLGVVFMIMTPIGVAIGIGIHTSFNANSSSAVLASAILDSLSAGILLYNAYVSLMSQEISHSASFRQSSFARKATCFLCMYTGAGVMALIGKWA